MLRSKHLRAWVLGCIASVVIGVPAIGRVETLPAFALPTVAGGQLEVQAAPTELTATEASVVAVRVANTGDGPVRDVEITVTGTPGVAAVAEPASIEMLAPHSAVIATVRTEGVPERQPAHLVVQVRGRTDVGESAALTSVKLVPIEASATISLTGNTRITDASPADIVAVVANAADVPVQASVRGQAGRNPVRLAAEGQDVSEAEANSPIKITIPARQSRNVFIQVQGERPLRRGTTTLIVTATVSRSPDSMPIDVSATRDLEVALSADVFPGVIGVGTALVVPGLVALWAGLSVYQWDRRRIGLEQPSPAKLIWENKLWLLAAVALSLIGAQLFSVAGFANILDTYTLRDIATITVVLAILAAGGMRAAVAGRRARIPAVPTEADPLEVPLEVLRAARRSDDRVLRPVYRHKDEEWYGLLVQRDGDAIVLSPPIHYSMDIPALRSKADAEADGSLKAALAKIEKEKDRTHKLRIGSRAPYKPGGMGAFYLEAPRAVRMRDVVPTGTEGEMILQYRDTP